MLVSASESIGPYAEALSLYEQFCQSSDLSSMQKCIDGYHTLLDAEKADEMDPHFKSAELDTINLSSSLRIYHVLIHLACAHETLFNLTGELDYLHSAMKYGQDALETCQAKKVLCPTVMVYYAKLLNAKAMHTQSNDPDWELNELRTAKALYQRANVLLLAGKQHPLWVVTRSLLGWTNFRRWKATGHLEDLEEAISLQRSALVQISTLRGHNKHWHLCCLGVQLQSRFERLLDPRDLDECISVLEEATQLCNIAHVDRQEVVLNMVQALVRKYIVLGTTEYLDQAQELGRQALSSTYCQAFGNLGDSRTSLLSVMSIIQLLLYQIHTVRHDADIYESVNLSREALLCCSRSSRNRWVLVGNLVNVLLSQFELEGDLGILEESAQLIGEILVALPGSHPERPYLNTAKAKVLAYRSRAMRDINDLNIAIDLGEEATADTRFVDPANILQFAMHLCDRFQVLHKAGDLERAIVMLNRVLETAPKGYMQRLGAVHQLSKALLLRGQYVSFHDCEDIDRAIGKITCHREELEQSSFRPESLRTLAACYFVKYRRTGDVIDAGHAFGIITDLLRTITLDQRDRYSCLVYAAELYMEDTPYQDVAMALELVSAALVEPQRDVRSRIQGVKTFLNMVETRYRDVFPLATSTVQMQLLDMYALLIALLPRVAFFGLRLHSRLKSLSMSHSVALAAASHALNISLPERALKILEQGRAVLWTHSLRLRFAIEDVPEQFRSPLIAVARKLERVIDAPPLGGNHDPHSADAEAAERRKQSEELNMLVKQIRGVPGMDRFLLNDCHSTLEKVAEKGPVIVLVSSTLACHAIVIKPSGEFLGIPLDTLTDSWLVSSGAMWRSAVTEARSTAKDSRKMVKSSNPPKSRSAEAEGVLRRLWESVVWPVISALRIEVRRATNLMERKICA
jgi:tetratricopeptide (TPR) repeat protein